MAAKPVLSRSLLQSNCLAFWVCKVKIPRLPCFYSGCRGLNFRGDSGESLVFQDKPVHLPTSQGHLLDDVGVPNA